MMTKMFRGDAFENRYRIDFTLTTTAPFHLGTGDVTEDEGRLSHAGKKDESTGEKSKETSEFSLVASDVHQKPMIPGSSLKGALHGWLLRLFSHFEKVAVLRDEADYHSEENKAIWEDEAKAKEKLSLLEMVFGSPVGAGKVDFWDVAFSQGVDEKPSKKVEDIIHWNQDRQTAILTSVAIDPVRGTAANGKLYNFEIVPEGVQFKGSLVGQNLAKEEVGMLLLVLNSFNSKINPVTLGAMSGRGFGRFESKVTGVHRLDSSNLKKWVKTALENDAAGFTALGEDGQLASESECQADQIRCFKESLLQQLGEV
jgi:CRISPR/Cas system CSM-associated protein Csm3 (group 7 of RAMP superfamily)